MRAEKIFPVLVCAILLIAGCSANPAGDEPISSDQSIWQLTDSAGEICGYLPEDSPDVEEIKQLIQRHVECVDNRSSRDVLFEEESATYTKPFLQYLETNQYQENLERMYKENNLSISSVVVYWNPSTFSEDCSSCKVDIDSVFKFTSGTDDYLNSIGVSLNRNYIEHRIYYCTQEEGMWKISNIEKSAISPQ